jgi:hypothetical protein
LRQQRFELVIGESQAVGQRRQRREIRGGGRDWKYGARDGFKTPKQQRGVPPVFAKRVYDPVLVHHSSHERASRPG